MKDARPEELVSAVRAIAGGNAALSSRATKMLLESVRPMRPVNTADNERLKDLSARELEVLMLVAKGYSNSEIGAKLFVSKPKVKTHVSHVLAKLRLRDRVQGRRFSLRARYC